MRIVGINVGSGGGEAEKAMGDIKQGVEGFAQAGGSGARDSAGASKEVTAKHGKMEVSKGEKKKKSEKTEAASTNKKE